MSEPNEKTDINLGRVATESITIALFLIGALTAIGAYQEFTRSLNPIVLALLFCILAMSLPLLLVWCLFRFQRLHGGIPFNIVPIGSGIIFLLISLALFLGPTYFNAFDRAALLGQINVEEHKEIIEAVAPRWLLIRIES